MTSAATTAAAARGPQIDDSGPYDRKFYLADDVPTVDASAFVASLVPSDGRPRIGRELYHWPISLPPGFHILSVPSDAAFVFHVDFPGPHDTLEVHDMASRSAAAARVPERRPHRTISDADMEPVRGDGHGEHGLWLRDCS